MLIPSARIFFIAPFRYAATGNCFVLQNGERVKVFRQVTQGSFLIWARIFFGGGGGQRHQNQLRPGCCWGLFLKKFSFREYFMVSALHY